MKNELLEQNVNVKKTFARELFGYVKGKSGSHPLLTGRGKEEATMSKVNRQENPQQNVQDAEPLNEQACGQSNELSSEWEGRNASHSIIYKLAAFLILLGFLVGAYNANRSYAWFTDTESVPFSLESGKVHYEVSYTTGGALMVPGENLFTSFKLANKSSIDTNVRLQIKYTVWEKNAEGNAVSKAAVYTENASLPSAADDQYLNLNIKTGDGGFALETIAGTSDLAGKWWTFADKVPAVAEDNAETGEPITVFEDPMEFYYDGPKTGNLFAGKPITVEIRLQAKQADHVEWANLTMIETFDGKTGL